MDRRLGPRRPSTGRGAPPAERRVDRCWSPWRSGRQEDCTPRPASHDAAMRGGGGASGRCRRRRGSAAAARRRAACGRPRRQVMRSLGSGSMERDRRRVLVLAYFFPPLGGAGVQRTLKFVRYLDPLGWDATVVTTRSRDYPAHDQSLLQEVPASARVVRTAAVPLGRWLGILLHRLHLRRVRAWVTWPDGGLGWAPFALLASLRAVRRDRPDVLYSTSTPYAGHLVALLVARITGLPWVADFRDEWAANVHLADQPRALAALTVRAESAVTGRARRVVVAADYFRLAGLPAGDPRRTEIVNGVDEADLPDPS